MNEGVSLCLQHKI